MNVTKSDFAKVSLLSLSALMASISATPSSAFEEIGHSVDFLQNAAAGQFAKIDVDGDSLEDLVFAGTSTNPILMALGKRADASLGFKMAKVVADDGHLVRVLAWRPAGTPHVLTISANNGIVRDYSGWPLVEQRRFNVVTNASSAIVGDVDNDGSDELLVATHAAVHAYSLVDGQALWNYSISGTTDLAVAQLDADPALEIILAGPVPGIILDGATHATEWQYIDGFGARLATGSLLAEGGTQWIGAQAWNLYTVFRAAPWSPLWSGTTSQDIGGIATANLDDNGIDSILQGDGQWGAVHVMDSATHQERFQIPNGGYGIKAVAGVDFDGSHRDQIAFASSQASSGDSLLTVANGLDGSVIWEFFPSSGPYLTTALGDVDGDGHLELVAASRAQYSFGAIAIFDAESGVEEWHSPEDIVFSDDPFNIEVWDIELAPHAMAPGMDIVLAGSTFYDGRITVMDGVTGAVRLQIGYNSAGPMRSRYLKDLGLVDYNSDGVLDYVAATQPATTGASGALLQVFSGVDGAPLWSSVAMGSGFSEINGVLVVDRPAGLPGKQLIAVLPDSLRSYDSSTGLLSWTLAVSNDGAFNVPLGENGPEIGVFRESGAMTFYSATTQSFIRNRSLPAPLHAVSALGGALHSLVAASADALVLVDGDSGTILDATDYLGTFPDSGSQIAFRGDSPTSWVIATGTEAALYRFRLNTSDTIFADSFESP